MPDWHMIGNFEDFEMRRTVVTKALRESLWIYFEVNRCLGKEEISYQREGVQVKASPRSKRSEVKVSGCITWKEGEAMTREEAAKGTEKQKPLQEEESMPSWDRWRIVSRKGPWSEACPQGKAHPSGTHVPAFLRSRSLELTGQTVIRDRNYYIFLMRRQKQFA